MNKEEQALILASINTEVDLLLMLEKRGMQLGEQLSKLFAVREKVKSWQLEKPSEKPAEAEKKLEKLD